MVTIKKSVSATRNVSNHSFPIFVPFVFATEFSYPSLIMMDFRFGLSRMEMSQSDQLG